MVGEPEQGSEVDGEVDHASADRCAPTEQEIEGDVGAALIHGPPVAGEPPGQEVDPFPGRSRHIRWQVQQQQVGGTGGSGLQHYSAVFDRPLEPPRGVIGVGDETELAKQGP